MRNLALLALMLTAACAGGTAGIPLPGTHGANIGVHPNPCQPNQPTCSNPSPVPTGDGPKPAPQGPPPTGSGLHVPYNGGPLLANVTEHLIVYTNGFPENDNPSSLDLANFVFDLGRSSLLAHIDSVYVPKGQFHFTSLTQITTLTAKTGTATEQTSSGTVTEPFYDLDAIDQDLLKVVGTNTGPNNLYSIILPDDDYLLCHENDPYCIANGLKEPCGDHDVIQTASKALVFVTLQHPSPPCGAASQLPSLAIIALNPAQTQETTLLHEIVEAITDPFWDGSPFSSPTANIPASLSPAGYQKSEWGEIADICAGWVADQGLNNDNYWVQPIWDNSTNSCYAAPTAITVVGLAKHGHARRF